MKQVPIKYERITRLHWHPKYILTGWFVICRVKYMLLRVHSHQPSIFSICWDTMLYKYKAPMSVACFGVCCQRTSGVPSRCVRGATNMHPFVSSHGSKAIQYAATLDGVSLK